MAEANEAQRRHWNSDVRLTRWRSREPMTTTVVATLTGHAGVEAGQRVLDVGCGGGRTTIAVAIRTGPDGAVTGADISAPMLDLARRRAAAEGLGNTHFVQADVQTATLDGAPFDAAISQFGVMFFEETMTAFANIRAHLRPGGRLTFACWQAEERNPWYTGGMLQPFCPPVPAPAPGKNAVGPFTLADPDYTTGVLAAAGWSAIEWTPAEHTATVDRDALLDSEDYLRYLQVPEDQVPQARAACERQLAPLERGDGRYDAPLAFQIFTARA